MKIHHLLRLVWPVGVATLLLASTTQAQVRQCTAQSPAYTVALVEVYTSQGCSSCPPADQWLSQLAKLPHASKSIVGLALHVDYWDYIGWKDPFAQNSFTQRQRAWSRLHGARGVYTPQVVLAGGDYREWWQGASFANDVAKINRIPAQASIEVSLTESMGMKVGAHSKLTEAAELFVALYENRLVTAVKKGENAGESLVNDRVVRYWSGPISITNGTATFDRPSHLLDKTVAQKQLATPYSSDRRNWGIAAFVQTRTGKILQATSCEL